MLPTNGQTQHVRSTSVLMDGALTSAVVELDPSGGGSGEPRVVAIHAGDAATAVKTAEDLGDAIVAPAPLDLHFHGAGGHVVPPAGDPATIDAFLETTNATPYEWLATLPIPTVPPADPVEHVAACAAALASGSSRCAGIRIEGLFLNPSRAGVWPPATFRAPDVDLLERIVDAAGGLLRIVDVAPELTGAPALIERMRDLGVVASLAHTDASWEQAMVAIDSGATLATHTWNAMRPVAHRDPGVIAAVLADERVTCELICDGVHLHPGTIQLSVAAKQAGGWVAVSDASPFAGCPNGDYDWAGTTVTHDGIALRDSEGRLAGSASLLWRALDVLPDAGVDATDTIIAMSAAPRRVLDPARPLGLAIGDPVWIGTLSP